jgi:phospholipid/cholesterol/gamma-HCH transport system substrate-binding protein
VNPFTPLKVPNSVLGVLAIIGLCIAGFVFLWTQAGGGGPTFSRPYTVSFATNDVKNLAPLGDVRIAGVKVGHVTSEKVVAAQAHVTLRIDPDVAPLHRGATVRVGLKSMIGQQFVEIVDGTGAVLHSGSVIPPDQVVAAVDIDELYGTFDAKTRKALAGTLTSLGPTVEHRQVEIAQLADGFSSLGAEGYTAVDAIAAQSGDLRRLLASLTQVIAALDTGRGQIADVVTQAQTIAAAAQSQRADLEESVRLLPEVMSNANDTMDSIDGLNHDLKPVTKDLRKAAPSLNVALEQLPPASKALKELVPPLDQALATARPTLQHVPPTSETLRTFVPVLDSLLRDVNPMVAYVEPYGTDVGAFFGNFGAAIDRPVENGIKPMHLAAVVNPAAVRGIPFPTGNLLPQVTYNPYPGALKADSTKQWTGQYPRIEREPK